ncbi:MAG TPA: indolepyruvate ferredoxin oxidoreductase family protein [Mycobacteriales bacterium]|nr:indolepyruvate ferredoxin oxidoreductase family protein [Mycobacteriales bacterium]
MTALDDRPAARLYTPADRYVLGARPVLLTGVQAIARLLVEQHVRDTRAGRRTASLVSGYPGSPLGGLDKLLLGLPQLKTEHDVHLVPGLNEELGATAVWGSQQVPGTPTHDGVVGVWYGKGPGVDRAGDALRHGNTYGASATGGVLVMAGDDPGAKSSTVPCTSERTLASFGMPVLTPRNGAELIAFGLYGVALSRLSGCWVGVKVLADVADGLWTVDEDFQALDITVPHVEWNGRPWTYQQLLMKDPRDSVLAEAALVGPRWEAVRRFGAVNPLDEITVLSRDAWLGIAATGTAYDAAVQALRDVGLSLDDLQRAGVRVLRVGMPYPLGEELVKDFARGLQQVLVVEEKTSFLEAQLKDVLYGTPDAPAVLGKKGLDGRPLVPADGQVSADRLDAVLRTVFGDRAELAPRRPGPRTQLTISPVKRTPYFCSGCPHNRSTPLPEGSLGGGGIGCHTMVTLTERPDQSVLGLTQMGGEGSQWIGQAPFTDVNHVFQNIGDGTFFHSGQLALQFCVAAGVNITYKLLYNSVVAMTGAQDAQGALTVAALTRKLHAEGVARIVVVSDEPRKHRREKHFAPGVTVRHRDDMDAVQRELRDVPGVTVLIYDQQCANEARRLRKRGKQEVRTTRVVIDEATCEGCGDCGVKSNCLSVQPVQTELGRKTRIDQTSCNTDYSCLLGDCPSFLTVTVAAKKKQPGRRTAPTAPEVGEPVLATSADIFLAGIGGTGIVTVNQLLATAGLRSSLDTTGLSGLDQVGLSQKAGPVTSHLRVGDRGPANRVGHGTADVLLAFDALVAADPKNLAVCSSDFTIAVVSTSETPTGTQVADPSTPPTDVAGQVRKIRDRVVKAFEIDALAASEAIFGSTAPANLLLVGAAYQLGVLPFPASAIEEAIELNGVAVAANVGAFRWGRVAVADPAAFAGVVSPAAAREPRVFDLGTSPLTGETRRLTAVRAQLLLEHSGRKRALEFVAVVERAWEAERLLGAQTAYSEAVARGVAHLWAYKDEYEVARLLTRPELLEEVQLQVPGATRVTYNLHPPALRGMGMDRKLALGAWSRPLLKATAKGRSLRGTRLDPFGRAHVRVVERELAASHTDLVERLTASLDAGSYPTAVAAAGASEQVRGFEDVKLRNVEKYRETLASLGL